MIVFHLLTATLAHTIASGGKETETISIHLFLDEHFQKSNSENRNGNDIIHLPNGIFSSCGYPVISRTLTLEGMKTELHISVEQNALETETENGVDMSSADEDWQLSIFRIRNSTVSLTSLCLHSEERSSLIASVSSSFVRVSESDIRSNGMNSPFVMLGGRTDGQSGDLGSCLDVWNCRHISSSLLSLVPLAELSRKSDHTVNAGKGWTTIEESGFASSIRISAGSLSICDCCLTFGTGPLIGFGSGMEVRELGVDDVVSRLKVSSQLMRSQILNTTNTPSNVKVDELFGMELTQVVTGNRVCSCTNHLYGTACVDMNANVMGSLLSLNTSFWSCLTDTPTHLGQHFKTQQRPTQSTAFFKLCTFKDCSSSSSYGSAINVDQTCSLLVEETSFKACREAPNSFSGGSAIYFKASIGATFSAKSSSFESCSCTMGGGSVALTRALSATLFNCVFIDSQSKSYGGCLYLGQWDAVSTSSSITDCLFENCRTTVTDPNNPYSGGALYFIEAVSFQLNFVTFRGNKAAMNPGNDIMFAGKPTPLITSERMVGCTSTSHSPRLRVFEEAAGKNDLLPTPTTTPSIVLCKATSDSDPAEFTLTMSEPITGTVLVLIDNSGGTRTPTSDQAPNIGRVLSFSFDNSDTSSCRVLLGENNLVQTPIDAYKVKTSSFVNSFILSVNCVLDESEENTLITISGRSIPSGVVHVTLSDNTVLAFEFLPNQSISEVLTVPLTEKSQKLRYGETYRIVSAQSQAQPNHPITVPSLINIIIPNPPRLTTLNEAEYDSALKTVRISLEGVNLEGTYKVTLSVNGTLETVTIDVLFSSSQGQLFGILFDTDTPTNVNVSFNTRYEIVEVKKGDVKVICMKGLSFATIAEPTRLLKLTVKGTDEQKKTVKLEMTGRVLDTTSTYKVGLSISETLKHTVEMRLNSTTGLWEGSALLNPSSSAELEYGKTYEVSSFQKGVSTTELLFEANSIEMIAEPSRLVKVESNDADGLNSTTLTLFTLALTIGAEYTLELKGTPLDSSSNSSHVVPLSYIATSQPTHSFPLSLYPTDGADLKYGHRYSVDWMKTGGTSTIIEINDCSFSTPVMPERLVKVLCDGTFSDTNQKTIAVTFESLGLKSLTEHWIVLNSTATDEVPSHTKTLKLTTDANGLLASHTAVLFPRKTDSDELEGQLEFGMTYTVDGFSRGVDSVLFDTEHITVTTPLEPARLTEISCTGSTDQKKKATLSMKGWMMRTDETYTLTLKVKDMTSNTRPTVELRFASSESGSGSAVLFSTTSTEVQLNYNTTYEVIGVTDSTLTSILFEDGLSFTTIAEPTRLVTMEFGYDDAKKNALIRMTGRVLDSTKEYEIELRDSGNQKKTIEMRFNPKLSEWEGSAILYSQSGSVELEYGMTYSVSGFKTKGEPSPHLYEVLTITIENEPSRIEGVSRVLDGKKSRMIVSLSGRELKSGMGKIGVCGGSSKWTSETEIVSGSDGKWTTQFLVGFSESSTVLEYGSTYTLRGLDGSAFFVNDGITITVPHPPVVSSMIPELNTSTHSSFRVVMSGSDLPASGSFTASFSESAGTFVISLSESSEWRSDWIVVSKQSAFEFNKTYTLTSLIDSSSGSADHLLCSGVTMTTPLGPTLTGLGGVSLTGASLDCVSIVVNVARIVADTFEVSLLDVDDAWKVPIPLSISFSSCDATEGVITHSVSWDSALQYGHRYEIDSMSSSTMSVSIPSPIIFEVPVMSSFDNVSIVLNSINTFIRIQLFGNGLVGKYAVTLTSNFSFIVTAESSTSAVSEEMALGWPDSLAFDTPFSIQSIVSTIPDSSIFLNGSLSFTTPKKQDSLSLFVDGRTGETSRFCGESSRPCSSVEVGWEFVSQLGVSTPTIGIVHSATLGSPIRVENGMVALLSNFGNVDPTLRIPSSACDHAESGMIVVSSSTLEIRDVDIVIDSLSPSFVLLSAQNSNLTLKEGSFVGPQSTPSSNDELSEEMCEWTSGILQLDHCTSSITDTKLNHLSFGAINMRNGSLEVVTSSFHANTPKLSSFTSLRRNIHCSEDGHIEIGSLTGGDGTGDDRSTWIAGESCVLSGKESITSSSFFVPSLISGSCTSSFTSKTKSFAITIVGKTLIPCGLTLEVFELSKDGREGQPRSFELNLNSTTSFSEKEIVLSLSESSLPTFAKSLEWRGRLVYGRDLHTDNSFVIQASSSDRFAQAMKDNMKWWIPALIVVCVLLIVLIVIVIVCIRRKPKKRGEEQQKSQSEMEEQIEMKVDEEGLGTIVGNGSTQPIGGLVTGMDQSFGPPTKEGQAMSRGNDGDETEMGVTVIGTGDGVAETRTLQKFETLYDRLHTTNREVNKKGMMESIVRGLQNAARINSTSQLFACLTSRWVLIDSNEQTWLKLKSPSLQMAGEDQNTLQNPTSIVSKGREEAEESKRWSAPETANEVASVDVKKVLVFRLGLVLWEIETGQVPFRELDAVNAQRQIGTGILPRMESIKNSKLVDLLTHCLSFQPDDRPTLDDVGKELSEVFGDGKQDLISKIAVEAHVKIEQ
ncbi:hypothetical protein BLNAU_3836 [Blattamonas nauphoetae]|uniref:Protein kinase domain-containing protein n=1 Tax=Blattamonas nauphoetae TaxID=2049346 RepID=A0ABQ9YBB6_9EUKA|nr:hypothetical protein BLNAU_3836 [Blattamonas nauphoetae]